MRRALVIAVFLTACARPEAPRCEDAARAPLTAPDRFLVGDAIELPRHPSIRLMESDLSASRADRRALGWLLARQLVEPVGRRDPDGEVWTVPRFATFYDREDLRRVYRRVRDGELTDAALDEAFYWNTTVVLDQEGWPADRLAAYIDAIDDPTRVNGLGGVSRVLYGPRAARHLLRSEDALLDCRNQGVDPLAGDASVAREERLVVSGCGVERFGPYFVADGGTLTATADGEVALRLLGGGACEDGECTVRGPARVELEATGVVDGEVGVELAWDDGADFFVPCLDGEMPGGATILKADYRRAELGVTVDGHDLSADGMRALREGDGDWASTASGPLDPGADSIHTVVLDDGSVYRLVGLHAMVKELDHWVWLTLFWNPDAALGDDRPASMDGVWSNYGLCAVTDFVENDPDPRAGAAGRLGDVLEATHEGVGGASWCSNPHIEQGAGNALSNCVGCHQHAGDAPMTSEAILQLEAQGRPLVRNTFPSDYVFSTSEVVDLFLEP